MFETTKKIIVFGEAGAGKSYLLNLIYGGKGKEGPFKVGASFESIT